MKKKTMKKKTTKSVKMNENEHCRMMKANALKMARSMARRWMAALTTKIDELRENASLDGRLVDEVQSAHRHIVSQCMDEIVRSGVGDHLTPYDAIMLINEEMRLAFNYGKKEHS